MRTKTQCERVKEYMVRFGSISTFEAFQDLGVTRLASRIHDLRMQGERIEVKRECARNRFGEKVRFARYRLSD